MKGIGDNLWSPSFDFYIKLVFRITNTNVFASFIAKNKMFL